MGRVILYIVVIISILWSAFAGYDLIINSKTRFAPEFVFNEKDQGVLLVRKLDELQFGDFIEFTKSNPFTRELENIQALNLGKINFYISANRPILLLEKSGHWKNSEINELEKSIKIANIKIDYDGVYALLSKGITVELSNKLLNDFKNVDKKASANFWNLKDTSQIIKTDIYALSSGYFQYQSSANNIKYGKAVSDSYEFSSVLPHGIEKYEFYERFYAAHTDSFFAKSPLNEWVDKGFVVAEFNNQTILITDYRPQQTPSLILMEKASNADSIVLDDEIKLFEGVQLTQDFPKNAEKSFYLFEIEDKSIFTESLELAKKIQVAYQMGETLGLNQQKSDQLFSGLPTYTNYRKVESDLKTSITFKSNLQFSVTTVPPGEQLLAATSSNWTNSELSDYIGFVPILDHIRGGYSLFAFNKEGDYLLINNNGDEVWKGKADTSFLDIPQVIDIFENDKHQLLFTTHKSVYLIDLNGNNVGSFPYQSDYLMTSSVSYFRWKNTTRFLVGNSKGELAMLNTSGSELNIVQASTKALKKNAFALNINGNLRGWCMDESNQKLLTYLESPTQTEKLGKTNASIFEKVGSEVVGFFELEGSVYSESMHQSNPVLISDGQLIPINENIAIKKKNNISLFNPNRQLIQTVNTGFNEILSTFLVTVNNSKYILVLDYLKNNIYCYNNNGELVDGFPKEGSHHINAAYDMQTNELNIYTIISNSLVCHKIKLAKNT